MSGNAAERLGAASPCMCRNACRRRGVARHSRMAVRSCPLGIHRPNAFTLIEVVVALAVILILAAVALPNVAGYLDQQRVEQTKTQLDVIRDALYNSTAGA